MAVDWDEIFIDRPDLDPPHYYSAIVSLIKYRLFLGWADAVIAMRQEEKKKQATGKKSPTGATNRIVYQPSIFKKGSIVAFRNEPFQEGNTYWVKSEKDSGRQLIKIENRITKSVQWISEKRLRSVSAF
jgi:hypothetical protein